MLLPDLVGPDPLDEIGQTAAKTVLLAEAGYRYGTERFAHLVRLVHPATAPDLVSSLYMEALNRIATGGLDEERAAAARRRAALAAEVLGISTPTQ